jgi:hypothetical protein
MEVQTAPSPVPLQPAAAPSQPAAPVRGTIAAAEPTAGGRSELELVRSLGEIILRAQEMQVERLLEQGKRLEETLSQQQCMLAALENKITVSPVMPSMPVMPSITATLPHEMEEQAALISELEPKQCGQVNMPAKKNKTKVYDKVAGCMETPAITPEDASPQASMISTVVSELSRKTSHSAHVPNIWGASFVMSNAFGLLVGIVICLNAVFLLLQTDYSARNPGEETPRFYIIAETSFFIIFAVELALRIWVYRRDFLIGDEWRWNIFDAIILITAAYEETVKLIQNDSTITKQATFLRAVRIVKLVRLMRIFRVVKVFRDLRIMMSSIVATMLTLFWSIVCLVMIMVTFATYFLTVVSDYQADNGPDPALNKFFGSMDKIILCLFQVTSGGFDWGEMADLLKPLSPMSVTVLCIYVSMMQYAILNILTGICCHTASKTAEDDFDITHLEEQKNEKSAQVKLAMYFRKHDMSGKGHITWKHLKHHWGNPEVRHWFGKLDLDRWHLQSFFSLLETNDGEDSSVDIDNFIRVCTRFRCNVKNIDLLAVNNEQDNASKKQYSELNHKIDAVHGLIMSNQLKSVTRVTNTLL